MVAGHARRSPSPRPTRVMIDEDGLPGGRARTVGIRNAGGDRNRATVGFPLSASPPRALYMNDSRAPAGSATAP